MSQFYPCELPIPYRTNFYDKIKTRKGDGRAYKKIYYNLRDMPSLEDDNKIMAEMWISLHEEFAGALAPAANLIAVPTLLDQCFIYPYALMTKSVRQRPAKYSFYPHIKHFVTPGTSHSLSLDFEVRRHKDEFVVERRGLTGFGWDDPKGAGVMKITCTNVKEIRVAPQQFNSLRLKLDLLNNDMRFLKENIGERLYMVSSVYFAHKMKFEYMLTSVNYMNDPQTYASEVPFKQCTKVINFDFPHMPLFGIPVAFNLQKVCLQTKKSFKEGIIDPRGYLVEKIDLVDNTKFKKEGLWQPHVTHHFDAQQDADNEAEIERRIAEERRLEASSE